LIHIVQQFANFYGGSERHALDLFDVLEKHTSVKLWSEFSPTQEFTENWPIALIRPKKLQFPKSGTLIFVGSCWHVGKWINFTNAKRIIVIHNYDHTSHKNWLTRVKSPWLPQIEWAFVSEEMRQSSGLQGKVICSPINMNSFARPEKEDTIEQGAEFTVGRHSRDRLEKFHQDDPELFLSLAKSGVKVRVMGGTCLLERLPEHENIELLAQGNMPAGDFLNQLDCFLYRTSSSWFEPSGRVVDEAMANALPVVCGEIGGYVGRIKQGENGYLFATNEQAIEYISGLRASQSFKQTVGKNAFETVNALYSGGLPKNVLDFYLGAHSPPKTIKNPEHANFN
jgi:glycosyltransferase involved in cell wall biosynthesis